MMKYAWLKGSVIVLALMLLGGLFFQSEAEARLGRGRSFGRRGSRTFSIKKRYNKPKRTQPSKSRVAPTTPSSSAAGAKTLQPRSSFWRSFGGGMAGGLLGGLLFRSLFGGPAAQAAPGSTGGFGIGLLDILLLAGIAYLIYALVRRRRLAAVAEGPALQSSAETISVQPSSQQPPYYEMQPEADQALESGIHHLKQMDQAFDETIFPDQVLDFFFRIQGAWSNRDMTPLKAELTDEIYRLLQEDAERLKAEGKINRMENIAIRSVNITEAWQEAGEDFITVRVYANLLDYMVDETTGELVSGSKTEPVKFEEYWTFTRSIGPNTWKLAAINQPD